LLVYTLLGLIISPLPYRRRYRIMTSWTRFALWWLKKTCGLGFRVSGLEHIPAGPAIIMCKHQSAWETMGLQLIFPPQIWVLKRELLRLPLFGWCLAMLDPIAIDRKSGRAALQQLLEQGSERLKTGRWVVIFPEGTRVPPGQKHRYGFGGGFLAEKTGCPIVPVAHNAGLFWPRHSIKKRPGMIDIVIGPAIDPKGRTVKEIISQVETWIETASDRLLTVPQTPPAVPLTEFES
jgi:1-acyl-sn-glycerol-3-phosphate acyltransferase